MSDRYAIKISYVGTSYCGWQRQSGSAALGAPSIQATLEEALEHLTGERANVVASGRTDAGVHATGQVAHFKLMKERVKPLEPRNIVRGLNTLLPPEVRILEAARVSDTFHAQRSAIGKRYVYYLMPEGMVPASLEPFVLERPKPLRRSDMKSALDSLVGTQDFGIFQASGGVVKDTVRTLRRAEIVERFAYPGGVPIWALTFEGTGFLKQMVRMIVGTAIAIGEGRKPPDTFEKALLTQNRALLGPTASARGLFLECVYYEVDPFGADGLEGGPYEHSS